MIDGVLKGLGVVALLLAIVLMATALYYGVRARQALGEVQDSFSNSGVADEADPSQYDYATCLDSGGLWIDEQCVFE